MSHFQKVMVMLLVAFSLRAVIAIGLQYQLDHRWQRSFLIEGDANGYWELAEKMAAGEAYAIHQPPRSVLRMPGFSALLSLSSIVSQGSFLFTRILLAGVGTFACWLVYRLGVELVDKQIGLIAGCCATISPVLAGFSVLILSETLFAVTLMISLLVMLRVLKIQNNKSLKRLTGWAVAAGVTITIACYVRPSWLLISPAFAIVVFTQAERKWRGLACGLCVMMGTLVALSPWMIRNYNVTGHWVMTTLWDGPSLYDGLHPQATGASDMQFIEDDGLFQSMSEYDANAEYRRRALEFTKQNPTRAIALSFSKLGRFWSPIPNASQFKQWWLQLIVGLFFLLLFLPALRGLWLSRKQFKLCLFTVGPVLYFSIIHAVFIGSLRYRLPVEYPLWVMSAVGINSWLGLCFPFLSQTTRNDNL